MAAVVGHVTDLKNGSYLGEVILRWHGMIEVNSCYVFLKIPIIKILKCAVSVVKLISR